MSGPQLAPWLEKPALAARTAGKLLPMPSAGFRLSQPTEGYAAPADRPLAVENDEALVARFKAGDEDAFLEIMHRYRGMIHSLTLGVMHDRGDAEELTQDAFIRAHRALPLFRGDSSLATWLYRIALYASRNRYAYFRRRRRHETLSLESPIEAGGDVALRDVLTSDDPTPSAQAELAELANGIKRALTRLTAKHREILQLRSTQFFSYGEIARMLGVGTGTVKSRICRARECLRRELLARRIIARETAV